VNGSIETTGANQRVTLYWRPGCVYCLRMRFVLRWHHLPVQRINIWADPDAAAYVRSVSKGNETVPTVVIDGAGVPALLDEACRVASPAGRIGLLGFSSAPSPLSQQEVVRKELTIAGSRLNRRMLPRVVEWLSSGRLKPEDMITQVFAASDARAAFDLIEREPDKTLKVQLDFA